MPARWWVMRDDGGVGCKRREGAEGEVSSRAALVVGSCFAESTALSFLCCSAAAPQRTAPLHCTTFFRAFSIFFFLCLTVLWPSPNPEACRPSVGGASGFSVIFGLIPPPLPQCVYTLKRRARSRSGVLWSVLAICSRRKRASRCTHTQSHSDRAREQHESHSIVPSKLEVKLLSVGSGGRLANQGC